MQRMCASIIASLFFALALPAQTPDTATIRGQVVDSSRAAVQGALVTINNKLNGVQQKVTTNDTGSFVFAGLPPADSYQVTADKTGFAEAQSSNISLEAGTAAEINLELNLPGLQATVTVTGAAGEVRTDEPQLGDYLSATHAEETPLLNRRITYLPLLDAANRPAINQGDVFMNEDLFTTNGTGRRQTWFEVDGSNAVDAWGRQTIFSNVPLDGVQEMTILDQCVFGGIRIDRGQCREHRHQKRWK